MRRGDAKNRPGAGMRSTGTTGERRRGGVVAGVRALVAASLAAALPGCEWAWDLGNRGQLESDVASVLKAGGLRSGPLRCHMVGASRTGTCEGTGLTGEVEAWAAAFRLVESTAGAPVVSGGACAARAGSSPRRVFATGRLELPKGPAFATFVLSFEPSTGALCVEATYPYG